MEVTVAPSTSELQVCLSLNNYLFLLHIGGSVSPPIDNWWDGVGGGWAKT